MSNNSSIIRYTTSTPTNKKFLPHNFSHWYSFNTTLSDKLHLLDQNHDLEL